MMANSLQATGWYGTDQAVDASSGPERKPRNEKDQARFACCCGVNGLAGLAAHVQVAVISRACDTSSAEIAHEVLAISCAGKLHIVALAASDIDASRGM